MLEYILIIMKDKKKAFINLSGNNTKINITGSDAEIPKSNKPKPVSFNKDTYESIFSAIQENKLNSIEFTGEDVFDYENRNEIINFCKALHDNEKIVETQIYANIRHKYEDLKSMNSETVEELLDQLDFIIEENGAIIDLGATAIQELFGNTAPIIVKK